MNKQEYIENVLGLSRFPSISSSGSVIGMKKAGCWRENDVTVQIGDYIYNLGQCREYENAWFKSSYESGATFQSRCKVDVNTREVFDIEEAGYAADYDDLTNEDVEFWDDNKIPCIVYCLEEINDRDLDDRYAALLEIKEGKAVWYSANIWRTPDSMLKICEEEFAERDN